MENNNRHNVMLAGLIILGILVIGLLISIYFLQRERDRERERAATPTTQTAPQNIQVIVKEQATTPSSNATAPPEGKGPTVITVPKQKGQQTPNIEIKREKPETKEKSQTNNGTTNQTNGKTGE